MTDRSTARCVGCGARPPKTETNYTLIARHGWRLTVATTANGRKAMELRCPACWGVHRLRTRPSGTQRVPSTSTVPPARSESRLPSSKKNELRPNRGFRRKS
jgi:hypothetical protein